MKLLKAFVTCLAWNFTIALSFGNGDMATTEPLLQYGQVGYLYIQLSKMTPKRRAVLKQKIKNRKAAKLRKVINQLLVGFDSKSPKTERKLHLKSQRKRNSRLKKYKKYHTN